MEMFNVVPSRSCQSWYQETNICLNGSLINPYYIMLIILNAMLYLIVKFWVNKSISEFWVLTFCFPTINMNIMLCLQSGTVCGTTLSIADSTLLNWPIVSLVFLFFLILFSNLFCVLVHDYTLSFNSVFYICLLYFSFIFIKIQIDLRMMYK